MARYGKDGKKAVLLDPFAKKSHHTKKHYL
jgi:hypothetical protein